MGSPVETTTEIRPFHIDIPDEALEERNRQELWIAGPA
jgi:hypothetical protein